MQDRERGVFGLLPLEAVTRVVGLKAVQFFGQRGFDVCAEEFVEDIGDRLQMFDRVHMCLPASVAFEFATQPRPGGTLPDPLTLSFRHCVSGTRSRSISHVLSA